jgi:hypothetical protein
VTPGMLVPSLPGRRSQAPADHTLRILYLTNIRSHERRGNLLVAKYPFIDVFAKLRKATISFVICVRPSFPVEHLGSHYTNVHEILYLTNFHEILHMTNFHETLYLNIFIKFVENIEVSLNYDNNNGYFP